jgi:hypothetical protein
MGSKSSRVHMAPVSQVAREQVHHALPAALEGALGSGSCLPGLLARCARTTSALLHGTK